MSLQIESTSWHARVYQFWHLRKHGFNKSGANLCGYVRAVLFWSWMRPLFIDGHVGRVPAAALSWGVLVLHIEYELKKHFGWTPLKYQGGVILWCIILSLSIWAGSWFDKLPSKKTSFRKVLEARADAFHDKVCPFVSFTKDDSAAD